MSKFNPQTRLDALPSKVVEDQFQLNRLSKCRQHASETNSWLLLLKVNQNASFLLFTLLIALCWVPARLAAQTIFPATNPSTNIYSSTYPFSVNDWDDAIVNCDMLQFEGYNTGYTFEPVSGFLKAIAYGKRACPSACTPTPTQGYVYVEDYYGNSGIAPLPPLARNPDVVLISATTAPYLYDMYSTAGGANVSYAALVVYNIGSNVYMQKYDIYGIGAPIGGPGVLTLAPHLQNWPCWYSCTGWQINTAGSTCDSNMGPHIDAFSDPNQTHYGMPDMHKIAVVWTETSIGSSTPHLWACYGDMMLHPSSLATADLGPMGFNADVAVTTNTSTRDEMLEIVYRDLNGSTPWLRVMEYNTSIFPLPTPGTAILGSVPITPLNSGLSYFSPRIEAMNQYDPAAGLAKWQVAVSMYNTSFMPGGFRAYGYNELTGSTSTPLSPLFDHLDVKAPCVAAGAGPSVFPGNIGSQQYTVGFFPRQHDTLYARNINPLTGGLIGPLDYYQVNHTSEPVTYDWESAKSYAMSNCSNSGKDLLTAWYDGTVIRYKHSSPNTMSFKTIPTNITPNALSNHIAVYPIPASDQLHVVGMPGANYTVNDATGRVLLKGNLNGLERLDISNLVPGVYLLSAISQNGEVRNTKFTKQ